jgi:carboxyl-terminal processing protease
MKKRTQRFAYSILISGALLISACATSVGPDAKSAVTPVRGLTNFMHAFQRIAKDYVDPIEAHVLLEQAMQGLLDASGKSLTQVGLPADYLQKYPQYVDAAKSRADTEKLLHESLKGRSTTDTKDVVFAALGAFNNLYAAIKAKDASLDDMKLFEGAIRGMVSKLDNASEYINAEDAKVLEPNPVTGAIGLELTKKDGRIEVVATIEESPARESGFLAGDVIESIDGKSLKELSLAQATLLLRGAVGTKAALVVAAPDGKRFETEVERKILIPKRVTGGMVGKDIAYVRVSGFPNGTLKHFSDKLAEFETTSGGLKGLILDLRGNNGGMLNEAVSVADELMAYGAIAQVQGKTANDVVTFEAKRYPKGVPREKFPVVVLVDGATALNSEIVAAALQDNQRALIVGSGTRGVASLHSAYPLPEGGALKLMKARLMRPSTVPFADRGVQPDVCIRAGKPVPRSADASVCPKTVRRYTAKETDVEFTVAVEYLSKPRSKPKAK